jgi:hypothetical protein
MILDHTMREIRERNLEHFKRNALSADQKALDIRDLLAYVDELIEELSYAPTPAAPPAVAACAPNGSPGTSIAALRGFLGTVDHVAAWRIASGRASGGRGLCMRGEDYKRR